MAIVTGCVFCEGNPDFGPRDSAYFIRLGDHFAHKAADAIQATDVRALMAAAKDAWARAAELGGMRPGELAPDLARIEDTRLDPWAFAVTYLSHHIRLEGKGITQSLMHAGLCDIGRQWVEPTSGTIGPRDALFAPRESGKSTMLYLILSLWAAAHGWREFVLGFSESSTQARLHLDSLVHELANNELLRQDFPDLCTAAIKTRGRTRSDRVDQWISQSGVIFMARGIETASLGVKVDNKRPDLILLDDIERGGGKYTAEAAQKVLRTVRESILPMGLGAAVVLVGTTTIAGGILHSVVKSALGTPDESTAWLDEDKFRCHYFPALVDGVSMWPERWPTADLLEMAGTRAFAAGYLGLPVSEDGTYWEPADFAYEIWQEALAADLTRDKSRCYGPTILTIDGAVTTKASSDRTALGVLSHSEDRTRIAVRDAIAGRWSAGQIRANINGLLALYPAIRLIVVESNQGGDLWDEVLAGIPCRIDKKPSSEPKYIRAAKALSIYQRGRVVHTKKMPEAEAEMCSFPNAPHDDYVDCISMGIEYLARRTKKPGPGAKSESWV